MSLYILIDEALDSLEHPDNPESNSILVQQIITNLMTDHPRRVQPLLQAPAETLPAEQGVAMSTVPVKTLIDEQLDEIERSLAVVNAGLPRELPITALPPKLAAAIKAGRIAVKAQ